MVNWLAALSWVQHAHRAGMGQHGGAVVTMSSIGASGHAPGMGLYGASKAMLNYVTAQLAVELGPSVRVNAVAPALVKTQFATRLYEGREAAVAATYPSSGSGCLRTSPLQSRFCCPTTPAG